MGGGLGVGGGACAGDGEDGEVKGVSKIGKWLNVFEWGGWGLMRRGFGNVWKDSQVNFFLVQRRCRLLLFSYRWPLQQQELPPWFLERQNITRRPPGSWELMTGCGRRRSRKKSIRHDSTLMI